MVTNNAIDLSTQGTAYYSGTAFSGIDASTAGFVLTSNGTGVAPSFKAAGGGGGGSLVQQTRATTSTPITTSTTFSLGSTPTNAGGVQVLAATITPTNASHILEIEYNFWISAGPLVFPTSILAGGISAVFQDATVNAVFAQVDTLCSSPSLSPPQNGCFEQAIYGRCFITAGTSSATTIKLYIGLLSGSTGPLYFLQTFSNQTFGGVQSAQLSLTEWTS